LSQNHLPLSWARAKISEPQLKIIKLPLSRLHWIPAAKIPFDLTFEQVHKKWLSALPVGFVLQFCNAPLSEFLLRHGGQIIQVGVEGVLDLKDHEDAPKRSVLQLVKRGRRWGRVQEVSSTPENLQRLQALMKCTPHAAKPQLAFTFRTQFDQTVRCFAFVAPDGRWMGAVTLSQNRRRYYHTELILRDKNAPTGVMETLVRATVRTLRAEGVEHWSLGSVPFLSMNDIGLAHCSTNNVTPLRSKTEVATSAGRLLKFAYNYEGLFNFKNKFLPRWQPIYLYGTPRLSWRAMLDLAIKMRYLHLVGHRLWEKMGAVVMRDT